MKKNDLITLVIEEMNDLGNGIAHHPTEEGHPVIFVLHGVVGDEAETRIIKVEKNYAIATIEHLIKPSQYRTENECESRNCGGCSYRNITYEAEKAIKKGIVQNAFRRNGIPDIVVDDVQSTNETYHYRNKGMYPVSIDKSGKIYAGFYASHSHQVVHGEHCLLQPEIFREIVLFICNFATEQNWTVYDETTGKGLLRHIYLRYAKGTNQILLTLCCNGNTLPSEGKLVGSLLSRFPEIVGILINENTKNTNVVLGTKFRTLYGVPYLEDILCKNVLRIAPDAFYQVNHNACELLYEIAKEKAHLNGTETLLDLYCGIGSIGLSMKDSVKKIVGIEIVENAVRCAKENAKRNGIGNAEFYCGDASAPEQFLKKAEECEDLSDSVVILDPPRKGTTKELVEYLAKKNFNRVLYISCNPETLARDTVNFLNNGYHFSSLTPVDLFPRTSGIESVLYFTKEKL